MRTSILSALLLGAGLTSILWLFLLYRNSMMEIHLATWMLC